MEEAPPPGALARAMEATWPPAAANAAAGALHEGAGMIPAPGYHYRVKEAP